MTSSRSSSARLSKPLFPAVIAVLWLAASAFSQVLTGTITGIVTDPTDAVVPGAAVSAKDLDTGKEYKTTSDAKGEFTLTNLPNSTYSVTVDSPGFARGQVARVELGVSQIVRVPMKLEVARTGTEVVVESQASTVQTEVKDIQIWERMKFQAKLEAFDVFNNPNFAGPSTSLDSTTFGQYTTTFDTARGGGVTSRIVQFGIAIKF